MKHGVLFVLVVAAASGCAKSDDDRPVGTGGLPGGGGGGGGHGTDDGGTTIDGGDGDKRVCVLTKDDPSLDHTCADDSAQGIKVALGDETIDGATDISGSYSSTSTIHASPNMLWRLSGGPIPTTLIPFVDGVFFFPVLSKTGLGALQTKAVATPGQSDVFIHVLDTDGTNAAGVSVTTDPNVGVPFVDLGGGQWSNIQTATGNAGYIWFAGINAGTFDVTLTKGTTSVTLYGVHAEQNAITFQPAQLSTITTAP